MDKKTFAQRRRAPELLKTFNDKERKEFAAFLKWRGNDNENKFWAKLRKYHPTYHVTDEALFNYVFPRKPYKERAYTKLVSDIYDQAKTFITLYDFETNECNKVHFANSTAMSLLRRGVKKEFKKTTSEQNEKFENKEKWNSFDYYYRYELEDIRYQGANFLDTYSQTVALQRTSNFFDVYFLLNKLKLLFVMHNRALILKNEQYEYHLEQEILAVIEKKERMDIPILHLYYLLVKLMHNLFDRRLFESFFEFLIAKQNEIDAMEYRQILTAGTNICLWNIEAGYTEGYLQDRFELTRILVERGYIIVENQVSHFRFRNAIRNAVEVNELDWASNFFHTFLPKVPAIHQERLETLNGAYLHFSKGKYDLLDPYLEKMRKTNFKLGSYDLLAYKKLEIETTYELFPKNPNDKEIESFDANLNALKKNFERKGFLPEKKKESYMNFLKNLLLLFSIRIGRRKKTKLKALPSVEWPWLLTKWEEI